MLAAGPLLLAALLRIQGIDFGNPFTYHPDEWIIAKSAMHMVHDRTVLPGNYFYSSFVIDLHALFVAGVRLLGGGTTLETGQTWLQPTELMPTQFPYVLAGRLMVAGLAVATVAGVMVAGYRLSGWVAAILGAVALAVMPLHAANSRYLTTDVPLAFACLLTLLATQQAVAAPRDRSWVLAGLAAGLAIGSKWSGIEALVIPLTAIAVRAIRQRSIRSIVTRPPLWITLATALVGLVVTTPAVLLDLGSIMDAFQFQVGVYSVANGTATTSTAAFNLQALVAGTSPLLLAAAIGGVILMLRRRGPIEVTVAVFLVATFVATSIPPHRFARNLLPMLPFIAVACGYLGAAVWDWVRARSHELRATIALTAAIMVALAVPAAATTYGDGVLLTKPDTRTVARDWVLANAPRNSILSRELYTPIFTDQEYRFHLQYFLARRNPEWYRGLGVEYMIASSYSYGRFTSDPSSGAAAFYQWLFQQPEVMRIDPSSDHPGPVIRIFHLTGN